MNRDSPIAGQLPRAANLLWKSAPAGLLIVLLALPFVAQELQHGDEQPTAPIAVPGKPVSPDSGKLSEHNIQWLKTQPPQTQMEFLLESAINHDKGATSFISESLESWRGKLTRSQRWQDLENTALYSNDLRVRAAAIEINLAVNGFEKTDETAAHLLESADQDHQYRGWYEWELGMLASRGVATGKIFDTLVTWTHDKDEQTRIRAVEGLAHIGSEDTIQIFLDVLRNEPVADVRERAGCSLAKSGMMSREQRMKAVPGLLELTDDPALNGTTREWVYQALREITDKSMPDDPATWRNWYSSHGSEATAQFKKADSWAVLGNN